MEWNSIETAPKDGTWILAIISGIHPNSKKPYNPIVVYWDEEHWSDDNNSVCGWDGLRNWQPTHWMPLPEPPQ